ncbi:MAG: class I SAM-dependent methyltransferase [Oceanospirillaceae bacterium]
MLNFAILPTPITHWIDDQFSKACTAGETEVRRLFHGRSGSISEFAQVVIDWLPSIAVIRLYDDLAPDKLAALIEFLAAKSEVSGVLIQERGRKRETKFHIAYGDVPQQLTVKEMGLSFQIEPLQFQNFGLFLDMRNGRSWLRANAQDCKVLNLFSYTCAFSVAAVAGGASLVVNVDLSKRALTIGRTNHQLNDHVKDAAMFMPYDMLKSWSRIKKPGPYDIVVIDPPSFQPGSFIAQNDYVKVLRRLDQLTCDGARVMLCHNDPGQSSEFVHALMAVECAEFSFVERLAVPEDFAELDIEKSCKVLIYQKNK